MLREKPEFTQEISKAGPPAVPEKESASGRTKREIIWSPEATAKGQQLASQISELDQQIKTLEDQGDLKVAQPLFRPMEALVAELEEIRREEEKGEALCREMRELFGEGFLGIEEVETAFTLQDGRKLVELTPEEKETAFRLLKAKLNEPDIKEFLAKTPKEELAKDWLLVLRLPKLSDGSSLTMKTLEEKLAPDMQARGQGKLLYKVDWYTGESFYTNDTPKDMHWQFVTRKTAPNTKDKKHPDQTKKLEKAAKAVHLDPAKTRRRAPVETLFDFAVSFRGKGQRILEEEYDWSDVRASGGSFVHVGHCGAKGARVGGWPLESADESMGASLSR